MAGIGGSLAAQDFVNDIYIPLETFWQRIGDRVLFVTAGQRRGEEIELSQITFQVATTAEVVPTAAAVRRTMEKLHKNVDYAIVVPLELLEQARTTKMMFMVFMGLIAAISLLVGGIGIMNIMLVSVSERTREIGLRKAMGAKPPVILLQFLVEAVVLCVVGGLVGLFFGNIIVAGIQFIPNFPLESISIPKWAVILSLGFSATVGIVFGLSPAIKAALLNPIDALRHE